MLTPGMILLGFDTCFGAVSVALARGDNGVLSDCWHASQPMNTGHAERLFPMIEDVLGRACIAIDDVDRIVTTVGPGTFTGMRTGVAAARAFALGIGAEVVGVTSLEVMAASPHVQLDDSCTELIVAADARRGEMYIQRFDPINRRPLGEPQLLPLEDASQLAKNGRVIFAGSGAEPIAEEAVKQGYSAIAVTPALLPEIVDILHYALRAPVYAGSVRPLYLRPPDAKPQAVHALLGQTEI